MRIQDLQDIKNLIHQKRFVEEKLKRMSLGANYRPERVNQLNRVNAQLAEIIERVYAEYIDF